MQGMQGMPCNPLRKDRLITDDSFLPIVGPTKLKDVGNNANNVVSSHTGTPMRK